ncbi:DUF411 domain-containing protein [Roseicyclus sp. F158]|uniref:DUF411 domain-containing protein n=1 Tax=Tropicimonas omnivorans TaxID=3075590 RepID=A0ABU3DH95_9RHOB|nr:DUF411 domain-containing protein [Roseicyclus sp. F158]MDT0683093.1 DUF411 domain-containing protein [Roseicyclus sp. F158]
MTNRRQFLVLSSAALTVAALPARAATPMHVHSAPSCGCCHAWADLARAAGYDVTVTELTDPGAQKAAMGVPANMVSCHTIEAGGYVFEGHVPFEAVAAVLADRPAITGLAVPGMPMGSPGMGDDPAARFDVIAFGGTPGAGRVYYRAGTAQPFEV